MPGALEDIAPEVSVIPLEDLQPDSKNANLGTARGRYMLDHSLRQYGAGRSILVDKEGRVIAGNKALEVAVDIGLDDAIVVQTDGTQLVAVQRTDLDLETDPKARELAYADNRASELGLDWSPDQILTDLTSGIDLASMFRDWELDAIQGIVREVDYDELWQGMPEFEQEDLTAFQTVKVHFASIGDIEAFATLVEQAITEKTRSIWYPKAETRTFMDKRYVEES